MADPRVPRKGENIKTPGSVGSIAPLNGKPTPADPYCLDEAEKKKQEGENEMSEEKHILSLTHDEVIQFFQGTHPLAVLLKELREDDEYVHNPPTQAEFENLLQLVIKRQEGKITTEEVAPAEQRAAARVNPSPQKISEYADPDNKAFPVDSATRVASAHSYIHKYWNAPSKKGVTASYGRNDFIRVHNNIVDAMSKHGVEHNYLDSLDEASGYKKNAEGKAVSVVDKGLAPGQKMLVAPKNEAKAKLSFDFVENQRVVSWSRDRMREQGSIEKIEGLVATVHWDCGLVTTELLASLMPSLSSKK
jgi:hypothetical protein